MAPLTLAAAPVLTVTVIVPLAAVLVLPAVMPANCPLPLISPAPVPLVLPKRAFRSSTKPAAPVAVFCTCSVVCTLCPTCTVPKFSVLLTRLPAAAWYTLPLTVTVCEVSDDRPSPLLPVPSEAKLICTVPVLAPDVLPSSRTPMLLLLLAPPASRLTAPPLVCAAPVKVPKLAFRPSVKLPDGAVLAMVSRPTALPPTRWLPSCTGLGVTGAAAARL